ncbi:PTS mannitol transporter subunit IICB [Carnobacterium alterfunditum]|uniref:PTS mannitol transporter subunit IICB n=1 Tax=Carnobacterium alterfunditum TaxID=28230 RepID=UPI003593279D
MAVNLIYQKRVIGGIIVEQTEKKGTKAAVQRIGSYLSGMVMPNIGAFIAWGIITALFIEAGWLPNEQLATMVEPMLKYLLPTLIGYTGGSMVYGQRGAVVGSIATIGVIVGSDVPMFIGAMALGPLGGYSIKKFDGIFKDKIKAGFEMLVNNFSSGIIGFILAIIAFYAVGPFVTALTNALASGVDWIVNAGLLPLANIFIEPAKILFLNNAINHGILTPLGIEQAAEAGKSILFLLEANPGPGLGLLLAYSFFGKGAAKSSAPGAVLIHFIGGIHEIYFPYVLMKPALFLAVMAGGVAGTFTNTVFNSGLVAAASPGSIIAVLAMTPRGSYLGVIMGVVVAAVVSFLVAMVILKSDKSEVAIEEDNFSTKVNESQSRKAESKGVNQTSTTPMMAADDTATVGQKDIKRIIFACDAGMGSSAMGASIMRKKVKDAGLDISVTNSAIGNLKDEEGLLVITQKELTPRAKQKTPSAIQVSVDNFLNSPKYEEIVENLKNQS